MTPDQIIEVVERLAWLADNGERPSRGELADAEAAIETVKALSWRPFPEEIPEKGTECVVLTFFDGKLVGTLDTWEMQRESPVGWSSATIETGVSWGNHDPCDVRFWKPVGPMPAV